MRRHRRHGELTVDVDADALDQWERNPRADRAQDVGSSPTTKPRVEQMRTFGLFTVAAMGLCIATANSAAAQENVFKLHHLLCAKAPAQPQHLEPWDRQAEENAAGRVKNEMYPARPQGGRPQARVQQ